MNPVHLWRSLTRDDAASTFKRLLVSRHVVDLQLIVWCSFVLMIVGSCFAYLWHVHVDPTGLIGSTALTSAIWGTSCAVIAWCYLTGSSRLGVVDLFRCEITTICTVTAVTETAPRLIAMHNDPPLQPVRFLSGEDYTPVFNTNSKDLEALEARVVAPTTEFYTYLKAFRDYLRRAGEISNPNLAVDKWQDIVRNAIYMLFLTLESARKSTEELIEFDPEKAESKIMILLSELVVYCFLLNYYKTHNETPYNARLEKLKLRENEYPQIVIDVYNETKGGKDPPGKDAWKRASALLGELNERYCEAFGRPIQGTSSCLLDAAKEDLPSILAV
jgi:hypothetical protein